MAAMHPVPSAAIAPQCCLQCGWRKLSTLQPGVQLIRPDGGAHVAQLRRLPHLAAMRSVSRDGHQPLGRDGHQPLGREMGTRDVQKQDQHAEDAHSPGIRVMLALVQIYKQGISPLLPGSCRYIPTCSTFAQQAFEMHGVLRGCLLTALRIARCNPLGGSGYDPVPKMWPYSWL